MAENQYTVLFRVSPPSYFGLPEGEKLVIKGQSGRPIVGPVVDGRSGKRVRHGSLPDYRNDDEAIRSSFQLDDAVLDVHDNFFSLALNAPNRAAALRTATELIDKFLRLLMTRQGDLFVYEIVQLEDSDGNVDPNPTPQFIELIRITTYNLESFRSHLEWSARRTHLSDERLEKALVYYEHARFLYNLRGHAQILSPHFSFMLTSAYLNIWKSISVVLGDPSTDHDYQSRFKDFGFPKNFWREELQPLVEVRNQYDCRTLLPRV